LGDIALGKDDVVPRDTSDGDVVLVEGERLGLASLLCDRQLDHAASSGISSRPRLIDVIPADPGGQEWPPPSPRPRSVRSTEAGAAWSAAGGATSAISGP